jgi:hypothetical protein
VEAFVPAREGEDMLNEKGAVDFNQFKAMAKDVGLFQFYTLNLIQRGKKDYE